VTALNSTVPIAWYWNRWCQLVLGLIAMMAISSPQYVWTLFTGPLNQKLGTTLAELQWTFAPDHSANLVLAATGLSG
jgi:MFS transporter, OFA family, oxalate/formate antiporter